MMESVSENSFSSVEEKRRRVTLNPLPPNFLRLPEIPLQQAAQINRVPHFIPFPAVPYDAIGRLIITVVQAKLNKNYGLPGVRMDPYVVIHVGNRILETPTNSAGGKNPKWNKTLASFISPGVESLEVEIFDERTFTTDERIAWCRVPLPKELFQGKVVDDWWNLSGKLGSRLEGNIAMTIQFQSLSNFPAQPIASPMAVMAGNAPVYYQDPPLTARSAEVVSDAQIKQLKEMFTGIDDDVIKSVIEANHGDTDSSINALLAMSS